jgi:type IV secretory pathway TrbF-like protein
MATPLRHTPAYEDRLTAWHNQRLWYLLCGAGAVIAVLIVVLCIVTLRSHNTPYVIEVNDKGEPTGTIQPFMDAQPVADNTIRWQLGEYIRQAFTISHTFTLNQMMLQHVYAMSAGQASKALTSYYRANHDARNPLVINAKYWQGVRVVRTLKLPAENAYQVDYVLDQHDRDHELSGVQSNWRATMRVMKAKPTNNNPLGIFVTDLDFEPEAK